MPEGPTDGAEVFAHPLAYVRHLHSWSHRDLVEVVARRAKAMGVSNVAARREKAWRWEHWDVTPDRVSQLALAAELGVSGSVVDLLPWPQWLSSVDGVQDVPYPLPTEGLAILSTSLEGALLDRRGFLLLTGSALTGLADSWLRAEPQRFLEALEGGRVSSEVVGSIEQRLPGLRVLEARLGGGHVRSLADAELQLVMGLLSRSAYSEQLGQRLCAVAAELAQVAGWASFDAGLHASAQRYWAAGLRAAHAADSRPLGANILKSMTLQCFDFDHLGEALVLSQSAREGAGPLSGRTAAMLALREARAHAALNDKRACENAFLDAENAFEITTVGDEPNWAGYFDEQEYYAQIASCYLELGDAKKADEWFDRALEAQQGLKVRDHVTYLVRRASAKLNLGDIDEACSFASTAALLIPRTQSARNIRRVNTFMARLEPWRNETVVIRLFETLSTNN